MSLAEQNWSSSALAVDLILFLGYRVVSLEIGFSLGFVSHCWHPDSLKAGEAILSLLQATCVGGRAWSK